MSGEQTGLQGQGLVKRLTDVAAYLSEGLVGPCAEWAETTSDMARPLLIAANLLRRAPAQKYHVSDPNHAPGCPLRTFVYEVGSGAVYPDCTCRTVIGDCEDCEQPIYHDEPYDRWADDILTHRTCAPTQEEPTPPSADVVGELLSLRNEVNCRREHGATGGHSLYYVEMRLDEILAALRGKDGTP